MTSASRARRPFSTFVAGVAMTAAILATVATGPTAAAQDLEPIPRPNRVELIICRRVASIIAQAHYSQRPLDEEVSREWFNEYFSRLDHNRTFFLESDIEEFRPYEDRLHKLVLANGRRRGPDEGESVSVAATFAMDVYERFLQRVAEWVESCGQRLEQPFDFTVEEEMLLDRSEGPWCATHEELEEVWRQRLKNTVLARRLAEEQAEDEGDEEQGNEGDEGDGGDDADDADERPLEERILNSYERYLRRRADVQAIDVLEIFLTSLTRVYDPHSAYMAPDTEEDFDISMRLSLQGIGALLTTKESYVEVVSVLPGGPAEADGRLKAGDRIIAVAQEGEEPVDVVDMPLRKVVRLIRGPKGTRVILTVLEAGSNTRSEIDIVRDEVQLTEQEAKSDIRTVPVGPGIHPEEAESEARVAVVSLPSFYADFAARRRGDPDYTSSTRDTRRLIEAAEEEGLDGLILDLRSNGGGALDEAVALAGLFVDSGPIVQVRNSTGRVEQREDPRNGVVFDGPMVVLVDRLSASASEIVAAALQDYGRAVVVGERATHGKGTVQTVVKLDRRLGIRIGGERPDAGSLKFTMAAFYRVTGGSTQVRGVTPDIVLPSFHDHMELGEEHLPHVLPWQKIEAVEVSGDIDVRPFLPELTRRSEQRVMHNPRMQELIRDIAEFAESRERETVTLNLEARRELQREEERWAERLRERNRRRRQAREDEDDEDGENDGAEDDRAEADDPTDEDLVLEEGLMVLGDLIALQQGTLTPDEEVAGPAAAAVPEPVDDEVGKGDPKN